MQHESANRGRIAALIMQRGVEDGDVNSNVVETGWGIVFSSPFVTPFRFVSFCFSSFSLK